MFTYRVDTHHHFLPPAYVEAVGDRPIARTLVSGRAPAWSPSHSIDAMDRNGIQTAVLSLSAPGFVCTDAAGTAKLCRVCNEYAARMTRDHRGRFGSFASLPLPDVDGSLREIAYCLDVLGAEGICLLSNYGGVYLGASQFAPVLEELDRRKALIYVHPTEGPCECVCGLPPASLEFPFDTTRTIASLMFSGSFAKYRNLRFIFSHAGGTIPFLAERLARLEARPEYREAVPDGVLQQLGKLYFDTALSANELALGALLRLTSVDHVLFGSDYPHAPEMTMSRSIRCLSELVPSPADLEKVERENALRLMPGLKARQVAERQVRV
ncbi:amidohydrolase family protein [Bradyrhizobium sp. CB2312]|uniref:amidohydrolase family protein n=1 Tax=Bradyrhizobium sp. CB2312 TaxID=3039155 RepID=UPI0024B13DF1|nr:amidohydrolase family protein [Bradyrhizobium sp. CB2312]WFU75453.1 amidohydrolase family protein [Bradyrhizobium sp. CB2312]